MTDPPSEPTGTAHHRVVALVFDGLAPFELGSVIETFGLARPELKTNQWYELDVCSPDVSPLRSLAGLQVIVPHGLEALRLADTVIVPGWPKQEPVPARVVDELRAAHARGARLASICTGAFVLAATGLLDGRRATTHWKHAHALRVAHPAVRVDESVLYVDDGSLLTSAGSAAGLDMCLHLIRRDHGSAVANTVARRLVLAPHREGSQAQFIEGPVGEPDDDRLRQAMDWALRNLADRSITVGELAARAFMSPRTFTRHFTDAAGRSPLAWLNQRRVHASLPLLESTDLSIEAVARTVGFGTSLNFRKHFRREMRVTPTAHRRTFAGTRAGREIQAGGVPLELPGVWAS